MAIPYWIVNLSQTRLDALEARWASPLTQAQLANPWQQVKLDGKALPGVWTFEEIERKLKAQANKKAGADGGSATIRGLLNPEFKLVGELYTPSHFKAWIDIAQDLDVVGKPSARAQHIVEHPAASLAGVRNILVLSFRYRPPRAGGPLVVTLGCMGVSARDGATKTPAPPPATPGTVPAIGLGRGATAPTLRDVIRPPGAAR